MKNKKKNDKDAEAEERLNEKPKVKSRYMDQSKHWLQKPARQAKPRFYREKVLKVSEAFESVKEKREALERFKSMNARTASRQLSVQRQEVNQIVARIDRVSSDQLNSEAPKIKEMIN